MDSLSKSNVELVPIDKITIGLRRRVKMGRLQGLIRSIQQHGLINPIILRNGCELVAGERRLQACTRLEWKTIPARRIEEMSDEELRAVELDENVEREPLTDYEADKARMAEIRAVEAKAAAQETGSNNAGTPRENASKTRPKKAKSGGPGRGRPKKASSKRSVAADTGVDPKTRDQIEYHVELAERFPFLQRPHWARYLVLAAGESLEKLSEAEQISAAALVDQDGIPPKTAIQILQNLAEMSDEKRKSIFIRARSNDDYERGVALSLAAAIPPDPDPGLMALGDAQKALARAHKECRAAEFKAELAELTKQAQDLLDRFRQYQRLRQKEFADG